MEMENGNTSLIFTATKTSSWPVIRGSLDDTVTYESSLSISDSDSVAAIRRKPTLVLRRPTSESPPCEITICFEQQHEVRQVYVRSTARIYEMYYAAEAKSDSDYLCTVRCGMATENGEMPEVTEEEVILKHTDVKESLHARSGMSDGPVDAVKSRSNSGNSTSEDGWVEVKVPDSPPNDDGTSDMKMNEIFLERGSQDFYEATAEIADVDPCMSISLRMLSIQSGECVYIDEVYIFADPVVSEDTNPPASRAEGLVGNTLMSMLVPSLLQLSKSQIRHMQDECDADKTERRMSEYVEPKLSGGSAVTFSQIQQGRVSDTAASQKDSSSQSSLLGSSMQTLDRDDKDKVDSSSGTNNLSSNPVERTLDQLLSRLARLEDFCLRFEENMVKPITRMEARLERVEQQLELLAENSHCSATALCAGISAPEFSSNISESSSFSKDGNTYSSCRAAEAAEPFKEEDYACGKSSVPPFDVSSPSIPHQLLPNLVVTAPEFSHIDDDEENDPFEATKESPKHELKKSLSINDALASALAGLLSSIATEPAMSIHTTEATHISNLESRDDHVASAIVLDYGPVGPSTHQNRSKGAVSMGSLALTSHEDYVKGDDQKSPVDCDSEVTIESVDVQDPMFGEGSANRCCDCSDDSQSEQDAEGSMNDCRLIADTVNMSEIGVERSKFCISNHTENSIRLCGNLSNDIPDDVSEAVDDNMDSTKEVVKEGSDVLLNFLKPSGSSVVDFSIPILDVEFLSQGTSVGNPPLEYLLSDVQEPIVDVLCVQEREEGANIKQNHLVEVVDKGSLAPLTVNHQLVDLDYYGSGSNAHLNIPGERLQDSPICSSQDVFASLI
ncbi:hypothetical protein Ancab_034990 [Ancistrocladus abbreviatus]